MGAEQSKHDQVLIEASAALYNFALISCRDEVDYVECFVTEDTALSVSDEVVLPTAAFMESLYITPDHRWFV